MWGGGAHKVYITAYAFQCLLELCADMKDIQFGKIIGRGSFAVVYRGTWLGKEVALKRIQLPSGSDPATLVTPKEVSILRYKNDFVIANNYHSSYRTHQYCQLTVLRNFKGRNSPLDGPDIMVQILGSFEIPPRLPDMNHLKAPFDAYVKDYVNLMLHSVLLVAKLNNCYKKSSDFYHLLQLSFSPH